MVSGCSQRAGKNISLIGQVKGSVDQRKKQLVPSEALSTCLPITVLRKYLKRGLLNSCQSFRILGWNTNKLRCLAVS